MGTLRVNERTNERGQISEECYLILIFTCDMMMMATRITTVSLCLLRLFFFCSALLLISM